MSPIRPVPLTMDGFTGVRDVWSHASDPTKVWFSENAYREVRNGGIVQRPGLARFSTSSLTSAQWIGSFDTLDGTRRTILVVNGTIVSTDFSAYTTEVSAANLATASITLSTSAVVYAVVYNNQLVISDGTNTPFMWNGTAGAGGLTSLTNSPVLYGQPTVYYGKLFGIKNSARSTLVWSEENAANTGYEAGGYSNAWVLGQSGSSPLVAILGRNDALYYWRQNSIGVIEGAVSPDFQTTGTHDAISREIGTNSPGSVYYYGTKLYFADQYARPWYINGRALVPLWDQVERVYRTVAGTSPFNIVRPYNMGETAPILSSTTECQWAACPLLNQVIMQTSSATGGGDYANQSSTGPMLAFDTQTDEYLGSYAFGHGVAGSPIAISRVRIGTVRKPSAPAHEVFGALVARSSNVVMAWMSPYSGYVDAIGTSALDDLQVTGTIIGPQQGYGHNREWQFDEVDIVGDTNDSSSSTVSFDYLTSYAHYSTLASTAVSLSFTDASYELKEQHLQLGIAGAGRWIRVRLRLTGTEEIRIWGWTIMGYPVSRELAKP